MDMFRSIIKSVASADTRNTPALQAADLLAWATNRTLSKPPDEPALGKHLEHIMKQIIPSFWTVWDQQKFRETCAAHAEPGDWDNYFVSAQAKTENAPAEP